MPARREAKTIFRAAGRTSGFKAKGHVMAKNTVCLWYDKDAEAAARFYAGPFPTAR